MDDQPDGGGDCRYRQRDGLEDELGALRAKVAAAEADIDLMRPVVDAAVAWCRIGLTDAIAADAALIDAVYTYSAGQVDVPAASVTDAEIEVLPRIDLGEYGNGPTVAERLTADIAGLRGLGSPLAVEAAAKLDTMLGLLMEAETARDRHAAALERVRATTRQLQTQLEAMVYQCRTDRSTAACGYGESHE